MRLNPRFSARFGVLVPFTNTNLEPDMQHLAPSDVGIYAERLGGYDVDEIPDDTQMAGLGAADLTEPLRLIEGARPDVILYGCTSATLTHGPSFDRSLAEKIRASSGAQSVTAAGALVHAARTLELSKIAFASPYVDAINDKAIAFLADEGVETVSRADIGRELGNYGQGELTPDEVYALGLEANTSDAQAIVLSCTDMRSVEVIDRLEAAAGKPVICSNQAMMFQALELIGRTPERGCGTLMQVAA
ncbi:MAG: Asp/Glu racemase [Pseudomonadota bacterium]